MLPFPQWNNPDTHGYPPVHHEVIGVIDLCDMLHTTSVVMVDSNKIMYASNLYPKGYLKLWMEMPAV
jgi:hypothetical protein